MAQSSKPGEPQHELSRAVVALFVPGNRPDRFDKALGAGADVIIIDWEDAVAPETKAEARDHTVQWVLGNTGAINRVVIRVNAPDSLEFSLDLDALTGLRKSLDNGFPAVMLAKAETASPLQHLVELSGAHPMVCALIESARGLDAAQGIALTQGVERLAFGALDFALDTGMAPEADVLNFARQELVMASRLAGKPPPLDSPETSISDVDLIHQASVNAKRLGMAGKLCIHPNQVGTVKNGFRPSKDLIEWAESVIGAGRNASQIDGKMVDQPVIERARRMLGMQEGA